MHYTLVWYICLIPLIIFTDYYSTVGAPIHCVRFRFFIEISASACRDISSRFSFKKNRNLTHGNGAPTVHCTMRRKMTRMCAPARLRLSTTDQLFYLSRQATGLSLVSNINETSMLCQQNINNLPTRNYQGFLKSYEIMKLWNIKQHSFVKENSKQTSTKHHHINLLSTPLASKCP